MRKMKKVMFLVLLVGVLACLFSQAVCAISEE